MTAAALAALVDDTRPVSRRRHTPRQLLHADAAITRCALCGAHVLGGPCTTPHDTYMPDPPPSHLRAVR